MSKKLIIIGCGGHAKVVADIAVKSGYQIEGFLDDCPSADTFMEFPVLGKVKDAANYSSYNFFVAIGNTKARREIYNSLIQQNLKLISLIHPAAVIASDVKIGVGSVVMAGVVVNSCAEIGKGCIINTCSSVDHECVIEDFAHISVGAHVAGTVKIGKNTWIGAGATVSNNINIVSDCVIGAGAVVVKSLAESGTYVGIPAKKIK